MKVSDYIADFLMREGIKYVFAVTGGASVHIIDSIANTRGIDYICPQHEQAGAMAADSYSRVTGNLGAAIATSGPGATNMITGVCCAYYDSIPVIYITGQVTTFRLKRDMGVRQLGFQETDTVDIYDHFTKYAVRVDDPNRIRFELEKAVYMAREGRPGPVVVDIPDDVGRGEVNAEEMQPFLLPEAADSQGPSIEQIEQCLNMISEASRPIIVLGWGVRLAKAEKVATELVRKLGFPVALTWAVMDLFPTDDPLVVGSFGTHGSRSGNFAVQNADLILAIGTRIDTRGAGSPINTFARGAKKIVVDIDPSELNKFSLQGLDVELPVQADAKLMIEELNTRVDSDNGTKLKEWLSKIHEWKANYPVCLPEYYLQKEANPYVFVKTLSRELTGGDLLVVDTGCAIAWMMQAFDFKENQRLFHDFNNTAMGYAVPAAIAASLAKGRQTVICVTGDGSLQMNIQELATIIKHQLPIKIFLLNNHGYSMIQQTQDQWLGSRYYGSTEYGGLAFPDFVRVSEAYGFETNSITTNDELSQGIKSALKCEGPAFCNIEIDSGHRVMPQVKFGRPIEDSEPLLNREEFLQNMIVSPVEASLS